MKVKLPPAPSGKRQAVPDQSIGDASPASRFSNINKAKTSSGCIIHKRVGADRRHRQKSFSIQKFSIPSQEQGFALAGESPRPPSWMEMGSPSVPRTHGFRYEDVEAGGQFWFAPPGHLECCLRFADHAAASMYRMGLMRAAVRQGNSNFPLVIRQSWTFPGGDHLGAGGISVSSRRADRFLPFPCYGELIPCSRKSGSLLSTN